jgi:ABC-type bacteriocin/lantibiotic exporter with double-glycine peptidase domain
MFSLLKRSWPLSLMSAVVCTLLLWLSAPSVCFVVLALSHLMALLFAYVLYDFGDKIEEIHQRRGH